MELSIRELEVDRWIERLVDGELSEPCRRSLLQQLDATPAGWKRLATAFLEAQAFREALRSGRNDCSAVFFSPANSTDSVEYTGGFADRAPAVQASADQTPAVSPSPLETSALGFDGFSLPDRCDLSLAAFPPAACSRTVSAASAPSQIESLGGGKALAAGATETRPAPGIGIFRAGWMLAASVVVAFWLGAETRTLISSYAGWPLFSPGKAPAPAPHLAEVSPSSAARVPFATPIDLADHPEAPPHDSGLVGALWMADGQSPEDGVRVPVYVGREHEERWLERATPLLAPAAVARLRAEGFRVESQRDVASLTLDDGWRIAIPVENVRISPASYRHFQ